MSRILDVLAYLILFHVITAFGWIPGDPTTGVAGTEDTGRFQAIAYVVYSFAITIVALRYHRALGQLTHGALFLCIVVFVHFSFLWSIAVGTTLQYLLRMDFLLLMMLALTAHWGFLNLMKAYSRIGAVLVWGSVILYFVAPGYARDGFGQLHGMFGHKNTFGAFAALIGAIWLAEYFFVSRNSMKIGGLAVCFLGIYLARSATAFISLFLSCAAVVCAAAISAVRREDRILVLGMFLLLALLAVTAIAYAPDVFLSEGLGRNETLTGRARVWHLAAELIRQRPLLGYGYHVIGDPNNHVGAALLAFGHPFTHPHNSWLATGLQLGLMGIVLQLWLYIHVTWMGIRRWAREPKQIEGIFITIVMIGMWVRSLPESDFLLIPSFEYGLLIALSWASPPQDRMRYRPARARPVFDIGRLSGVLRQT